MRIAHGGTPAPAAMIVRPDGFGAWDTIYHLQWLADGKPPLTFDLAYGLEDTGTALDAERHIATGLTTDAQRRRHLRLRLGRVGAGQQQGLLGAAHRHRRRRQLDLHRLALRATIFHSGG